MTDPKTLEAEIEEERNALVDTLTSLTEGFKPSEMMKNWEDSAPELAQKAVTVAKDNPLAIGVIGAGIALLAFGQSRPSEDRGTAFRINGEADPVRTKVAEAKHKAVTTAAQMRDKIYEGTADLSDVARARIVQARQKALDAQIHIESASKKVADGSRDTFQTNPLAVCAGVAVAGAAIAAMLPRTKIEDDTFGEHRDSLITQAEAIFREETERAMAQGREAMNAAQDALTSPEQREDSAKSAVSKPH